MTAEQDPFVSVRALGKSTLENHRMMFALVHSVEGALRDAGKALSNENRLEALLPLMQVKKAPGDVAFQATVVYLLALLMPLADDALLKRHYSALYAGLTAGLDAFRSSAPWMRSAMVVVERLLTPFDADSPDSLVDLFRRLLLETTIDARPKVRKEAQHFAAKVSSCSPRLLGLVSDFVRTCFARTGHSRDSVILLHLVPLLRLISPSASVPILADVYGHCVSLKSKFLTAELLSLIASISSLDDSRASEKLAAAVLASDVIDDVSRKALARLLPGIADEVLIESVVALIVPEPPLLAPWAAIADGLASTSSTASLLLEKTAEHFAWLSRSATNVRAAIEASETAIDGLCRTTSLVLSPCKQTESILQAVGKIYEMPVSRPANSSLLSLASRAIRVCGVEWTWSALSKSECVWLLPLIRDDPRDASCAFFLAQLLPLHRRFSELAADAKKADNARRFTVVADQAMQCLPGILRNAADLSDSWASLWPILSVGDVEMWRVQAIEAAFSNEKCQLGSRCMDFLPLLLNWYMAASDGKVNLSLVDALKKAIRAVVGAPTDPQRTLQAFVARLVQRTASPSANFSQLAVVVELLGMVLERHPTLAQSDVAPCLLPLLSSGAAPVQKHAYRTLAVVSKSVSPDQLRDAVSEALGALKPGICRPRLALLETMASRDSSLIPHFMPEVILALKDNSQKARDAAFDLIVSWAEKASTSNDGSLDQLLLMVTAGFAAKTPHMISASVTAATRLVYGFWNRGLAPNLAASCLADVCMFMEASASREVVKACIGFAKMVVVAMPKEFLLEHLSVMLRSVLQWSQVHQQSFKVKTRHIVERAIRRVGIEPVRAVFPRDHAGLLRNLEKRKQRAAKKRDDAISSSNIAKKAKTVATTSANKKETNDNFDRDMHGTSDSELENGSAEEDVEAQPAVDDEDQIEESLKRALRRKLSTLKLTKASNSGKRSIQSVYDEVASDDASEADDDFEFEEQDAEGKAFAIKKRSGDSSDDDY